MLKVRVVSLEQSLYEGEAGFVIANGGNGELGVLTGHAPLLTTLRPGPLVIKNAPGERDEQVIVVSGGFMEVLPDRVTVLADAAEHAEEISEQQAEAARERAAEALQGELAPEEASRMTIELEMAEARLRLARIRRRGGA